MTNCIEYEDLPHEARTMQGYAADYLMRIKQQEVMHNGASGHLIDAYPPTPPLTESDIDSGAFDEILLAYAKLPTETESKRLSLLQQVGESVLKPNAGGRRNEHRVGRFLQTCTEIFSDMATPPHLKEATSFLVTPEQFDGLLEEGARSTWQMENTEALFHAYVRLQTVERVYGVEEGRRLKRQVVKAAIESRELDRVGDMAAMDEAVNSTPSRTVIHLGHAGHELAQKTIQIVATHEARKLGVKPRYAVYYRDGAVVEGDEEDGLMSDEQILQEKRRRGNPPRGAGVDLPTFGGTEDADGEPTIMVGLANVGAHLIKSVGKAAETRQRAIIESGITFDGPKRNDQYRKIQLGKPTDIFITFTGEGGLNNFHAAIQYARLWRTPSLILTEFNNQSIGTEADEIRAQSDAWKLGHGEGVAGTEIGEDDIDGQMLFARGSTVWLANGGEPLYGVLHTQRVVAHSTHHGDNKVPELVGEAVGILEQEMQTIESGIPDEAVWETMRQFERDYRKQKQDSSPASLSENIRTYLDQAGTLDQRSIALLLQNPSRIELWLKLKGFHDFELFHSERTDYTTVIRDRLRLFVDQNLNVLQQNTRDELLQVAESVHDPLEAVVRKMQAEGILTEDEERQWRDEAYARYKSVDDRVKTQPMPDPANADKHLQYPAPAIIVRTVSNENDQQRYPCSVEADWMDREVTMSGVEAQRAVLLQRHRENPSFVTASVDGNKGKRIRKEDKEKNRVIFHKEQVGGYFKQLDGVWQAVGHLPGRFWNLPINERVNTDLFHGYTYQPTARIARDIALQQMLLNGEIELDDPRLRSLMTRAFIDGAYADYQAQAISESAFIHASILQASGGKYTSMVGFSLPEGVVDGAGFMHCGQMEAMANQAPGLRVYTVSRPRLLHDVLNYQTQFQYDPWCIAIARSAFGQKETWTEGTGYFEPGRDYHVKDGKDALVIAWSSMMPRVEKNVAEVEKNIPGSSVRILEKVSWSDCTGDDLEQAIKETSGDIIIGTEESEARSIGNQLVTQLATSERFYPLTCGSGRRIRMFAMKGNAHVPGDIRLVNGLRLSDGEIVDLIGRSVSEEKERQKRA